MVKTVAVFNSSEDVVKLLRAALDLAGFKTVEGHIPEVKRGREDFAAFLKVHDPDVIVYDLSPPYLENWRFFQVMLNDETAKHRRFVLTTTSKQLLEEAVGSEVNALEISEKPYRLAAIVDAVKKQV